MNRFHEQFNTKAQQVKMSPEERGLVRERILSFMELHALPEPEVVPAAVRFDVMAYLRYWKQASVAFVLMLMVTPILAENALPGDMLYPLKVNVNEEVRGYLAWSPYEKIAWETERIERRIAEARLLADEGKLSPEEEAEVVAAVATHSANAQASIAELKETDSEEASIAQIAFASALEVQADALQNERVSAAERGEAPQHLQLSAAVAAESSEATEAAEGADSPSLEKLFARLEAEGTIAEELLVTVGANATEEESEKINKRLLSITRKVENAHLLADGSTTSVTYTVNGTEQTTDSAQVLLRAALSDVRKLISFMTNIDVRESISVDVVVPDEPEIIFEPAATTTDSTATASTTADTEVQATTTEAEVEAEL